MSEFGHGETPQVAHDLRDVLIYGIDVEKVVLHLADDAFPGRQVGAQQVKLIEAAEFMDQPAGTLEQPQEEGSS